MAGRCIGVEPSRVIMCDDFDSYCDGGTAWPGYPPTDPAPAACASGSSSSSTNFRANWAEMTGACGFDMRIGDDQKYSSPFSMKYPAGIEDFIDVEEEQRVYDMLGQGAIGMAASRRGVSTANAVNGTADAPLTFFFILWLGGTDNLFGQFKDLYLELALGDDRAPTDYVMSENCSQIPCGGPSTGFPIVCQTANPLVPRPSACPPLSTTIHAAMAFGLLSKIDMNPCHPELCSTGAHHPQNNHPAFFDGNRWWVVKGGYGGANGDFSLTKAYHRFSMTITDTQVTLNMWAPGAAVSPYTATFPRQYTGPFDRVRIGVGQGCVLNGTTGECAAPVTYDCINGSHGGNPWVDDVVLYDGVLVNEGVGACCLDGVCTENGSSADCAAQGGTFLGNNSTCTSAVCCPTPWADADNDNDVDQADFGAYQLCYTGSSGGVPAGCECFDRNADSKVDATDFNAFSNCFTGANVPWSQTIAPTCTP